MWEGIGTTTLGESVMGRVVPELVAVIEVLIDSVSEALIVGVVAVMPGDIINGVVMATASEVVVGKVGITVTLGVVPTELLTVVDDIRPFCFVSKALFEAIIAT